MVFFLTTTTTLESKKKKKRLYAVRARESSPKRGSGVLVVVGVVFAGSFLLLNRTIFPLLRRKERTKKVGGLFRVLVC